jgi:hypothetical protein
MYEIYDSVGKVKYFKSNFGKYPARLPNAWEQYSSATGITIAVTWKNRTIFN